MAGGGSLLGILVELLGTFFSVLGLNTMKWTAMHPPVEGHSAYLSPRFVGALTLYTTGQLTEVVALAFGNSAVLSACSASALVWNAVLANRIFGERFTAQDAYATVAICAGTHGPMRRESERCGAGIICSAVTGPPKHDLTVIRSRFPNPC